MHVKNNLQLADLFTKALSISSFRQLLSKMGLYNIHLEGKYEDSMRKSDEVHEHAMKRDVKDRK